MRLTENRPGDCLNHRGTTWQANTSFSMVQRPSPCSRPPPAGNERAQSRPLPRFPLHYTFCGYRTVESHSQASRMAITSCDAPAGTLAAKRTSRNRLAVANDWKANGKHRAPGPRGRKGIPRTSRACDRCRFQKVRCQINAREGDRTCERCARSESDCSFFVPQKKRGPAPQNARQR